MLYPSIDELMEKIDSKYTLVTIAARRARVIQATNSSQLERTESNKPVGKALEEVYAGKLVPETSQA
ncbi:DNA-directed RNA polymerase subunit omega [Pseudalkalibacillus caeni]|uniref:DNA-directed RNA polymerase subunit omega n=1 Tax=Exobacillus caeni TaxID=2574798 RepID=A0A5R9F1V4_9BACL|nr:DNA-directed RNA polymerase subunit omega [Pseudalkalibacillus caeni]TLS37612.1 DNA-directed RNA polymerase subunit omega [Pseudalkalibacillus caeni]